jgi:hypothetical protein
MRCKKLISVLLTAIFLLGTVVPLLAGDGRPQKWAEPRLQDHPWQDDNGKGGKMTKQLNFFVGPWVFSLNISVPTLVKPAAVPADKEKPTTPKKVKGK